MNELILPVAVFVFTMICIGLFLTLLEFQYNVRSEQRKASWRNPLAEFAMRLIESYEEKSLQPVLIRERSDDRSGDKGRS